MSPPRPAPPKRPAPRTIALAAAAALALAGASSALAWTPRTQATIAAEAARLAPPDLARQIERHEKELRAGVLEPFRDGEPARHSGAPGGRLATTVNEEAARAVAMIERHHPFADVVHQLGVVAHFVADADYPLNAADSDPREATYFGDYARYLESAEPRLPLVFYGVARGLENRSDLGLLVGSSLARGRQLYPLVGREYARIGYVSGLGRFDDRSTAFGVGSLAFSHAVTDVARALRWVWLRAGGADPRDGLPPAGGELLLRLPRATAGRAAAGPR